MPSYKKKPIVIEAWQWLYSPEQKPAPPWVNDALFKWPQIGGIAFEPGHPEGARIAIATLDAVAIASPGDWICKGIRDELYPCKPDIFDATYDLLPELVPAND